MGQRSLEQVLLEQTCNPIHSGSLSLLYTKDFVIFTVPRQPKQNKQTNKQTTKKQFDKKKQSAERRNIHFWLVSKRNLRYLVLDLLQKIFYTSDAARESFVELCEEEYVQKVGPSEGSEERWKVCAVWDRMDPVENGYED